MDIYQGHVIFWKRLSTDENILGSTLVSQFVFIDVIKLNKNIAMSCSLLAVYVWLSIEIIYVKLKSHNFINFLISMMDDKQIYSKKHLIPKTSPTAIAEVLPANQRTNVSYDWHFKLSHSIILQN